MASDHYLFPPMVRRLLPLAVSLCMPLCVAAAEEIIPGKIVDPIVCAKDPSQSYALYLPSNYTPEKTWPVIFCLDPVARGRVGVERLQAAAEKYGYVLAGSNNSRNGPSQPSAFAIASMIADVGARFSIEKQRIYTAGLSGGARVAIQVAISGVAQGVIACSAGYPPSEIFPSKVSFPIFGTAGIEDFNYAELKRAEEELGNKGAPHRMVFFNGGHEWASSELMMEAVAWLELKAMQAGTRPKDEALINTLLQGRVAGAPAKPASAAWQSAKWLAEDFKGLVPTADFEKKAKELGQTKEVKDWQRQEAVQLRREEDTLLGLLDLSSPGQALRKATDLRQKAAASQDSPDRQMARRIISGFLNAARDNALSMLSEQRYTDAATTLEVMAELRPQSRTYYDLARAHAFAGDKKESLDALRQAIATGYRNAAQAKAEPAFKNLADDREFQDVLASMQSGSKAK